MTMNLLTKKEVAERLRCPEKTISYYVSSRQIPFVMIGKNAMFIEESVNKWLKDRESQAAFNPDEEA